MSKRTTARDISECKLCLDRTTPELMAAAASVGIERNRSTRDMVLIYLRGYHDRGHQECDA